MRRLLLPRRGDGDHGVALPTVIILGAVLMAFVATGLSAATSGLRQSVTDVSATSAYDAAYAGVQDYLARLNSDAAYASRGNPAAVFSAGSSVALPVSPATNPAFGLGADGSWATVRDGTTATSSDTCAPAATTIPCFRYEVDNRVFDTSGIVRVRSTGRLGSITRSVVVAIKRQGFVNFLYFTDFETQDPTFSGNKACAVYAWSGKRPAACATIQFAAADTLSGPVHSNDTIAVCGATFGSAVTTASTDPKIVSTPTDCSKGTYQPGYPKQVSQITMPATNSAMRAQTRSDLAVTTGCLYTGPTVVKYLGNGQMTVWSPWSKFTNITASTTAGSNPDKCGKPGTAAGQLGNKTGATVDELASNLLYVQTVPGAADPNYSATTSIPKDMTCIGPDGSSSVSDAASSVGWTFGPWSFPTNGEAPPDGWDTTAGVGAAYWGKNGAWSTALPAYNCRNGDLYLKGQYTTQTTAASDDYVYVIGDLKAKDLAADVIGLVGNNAVLVWNPISPSNASLLYVDGTTTVDKDREIHAAVLSVAHTFTVQNYDVGPNRGTLTVTGSIAQKFRGPVATSGGGGTIATGYAKNYQYDDLLKAVSPPYFLAPSTTNFVPQLYASVPRAFLPTGAAP